MSSDDDDSDLWIVVTDPIINAIDVLILNLSSVKGGRFEDLSCLFEPGEHEKITKQSYIRYGDARICTNAYLDRTTTPSIAWTYDSFQSSLLNRIYAGAAISRKISFECRALLKSQGLIV